VIDSNHPGVFLFPSPDAISDALTGRNGPSGGGP
jgi:hypothetical protein